MSRKIFTSQKISLFLAGKEVRVQTLISISGAKYVFDDTDLPAEARASFGAEIGASYKGIPVRCRFVKEMVPAGTIYGLRFVNPSNLLMKQIDKDIETSGIPSPWMRSLPRLLTTAKNLPVPVLAVTEFEGGSYYLNVKNFTLGGLLLEYIGAEFDSIRLGQRLTLDLVTNGGEKFSEIQAVVTHVSVELGPKGKDADRIQFGVKFAAMNSLAEMKYKGLIREHCEGLKNQMVPQAG